MGEQLKASRGRAGMTQQELADALGVGRRTVAAWELDERPIPLTQQSQANPLAAYPSVDLLAEVIRITRTECLHRSSAVR